MAQRGGIICWRYFVVLSTVLGRNVHLLNYPFCKPNNNVIECIKENEILKKEIMVGNFQIWGGNGQPGLWISTNSK